MTGTLHKLWREITDPAHWLAMGRYLKSADMRGLAMQLQGFYLRQQKRKKILRINPARHAPEPSHWPDDQPLISVIITCVNYGEFVRDAVDSVLAQHFQDFEIILIDGGSTDGSDEIVAGIADPKIHVFLREGLHLSGDNRNFGIKQARGKYVCCLDADDMMTPDFLLKLVFLLEATNLDVAGTAKKFFGDINRVYHGVSQPTLGDLRISNPVSASSLYPKLLWDQTGPFQDFGTDRNYIFEDWEFWYRAALHGARFYMANGEPLFLHRVHDHSISYNTAIRPHKAHARFINKRHVAATDLRILNYSRQQRNNVQLRHNPLVNLLRQPQPGLYDSMLVTDQMQQARDSKTLLISLSPDDTTTTYCLPRFLPALLYTDFMRFLQFYFAIETIKTPLTRPK